MWGIAIPLVVRAAASNGFRRSATVVLNVEDKVRTPLGSVCR